MRLAKIVLPSNGLRRWLSALLVLLALAQSAQLSPAQGRPAPPEQVAREFYVWYLRAGFPSPKGKHLPAFRKYVTPRLVREQLGPSFDAVVFLGGISDYDDTWRVSGVSKASVRGGRATALVTLEGVQWSHRMRVELRRESGAWKIDRVRRALRQ